jgi:adenylate kinase family enzyme
MRRVAVIGTSGSGKTTVAGRLAQRLGVPQVELDALHHGPNWSEPELEDFRRRVSEATSGEGWVVDGNYMRKLDNLILERADTIVWLDLPLRTALRRLWRRTTSRIRDDIELWSGNRESWRGAFWGRESLFAWTVRSHLARKRSLPERLSSSELAHARIVRLRSPHEVEEWLAALPVRVRT